MSRWTGPLPQDWAPGAEYRLCAPVPPARWPFGPPSDHQECCSLHRSGLFCDCTASDEEETCVKCGEPVADCDCTGGPETEIECTCYEPEFGHQMGCPYYGRRSVT